MAVFHLQSYLLSVGEIQCSDKDHVCGLEVRKCCAVEPQTVVVDVVVVVVVVV